MPNYQYHCPKCNITTNIFHSMKDETSYSCLSCDAVLTKQITGGLGVIFSGSGFYENDYKNK
jgi:putative FmdB family regulatory protein